MSEIQDEPYVLISADTHAGADILDYKAYLASSWHEEFDEWAGSFTDAWGLLDEADEESKVGPSSFGSSVNWDTPKRREHLENQGIVGEVVFPNTVPPFYPSGVISAPGPRTQDEYDRRWAGVKAHNRWLVDFCAEMPGRRAGIAQLFLYDADDAVKEVHWAKEHGLAGVLLPADHLLKMENLYYPRFDRVWEACADLGMPVHRHVIVPSEAASEESGDAAPAVGRHEAYWYGQRPLTHLILAGVFDRFPKLRFVTTESLAQWVVPHLAALDLYCESAMDSSTLTSFYAGPAVAKLKRKPSEYFATNCYLGSFFNRGDIDARHDIGVDRLMWGADYPHHEGTYPYTMEALRVDFAGVSQEDVRMMTSGTAADVYGFDLANLREIANEVGPRPSQVDVPLPRDQWPTDSVCPTLTTDWRDLVKSVS